MKRDTLGFRIGRLLLWLGMILLLLVAGVGMLLEQTLPRQNGTIRVAGAKAPIEIGRDAMGVVTVRAGSEADAAFAMGFAHAQDRLFQMDLMRRLGAGRLSEVLGAGTLRTDEFMRKLGLYRVAEANYRNLPPDAQALFQAYADGVNAFLARRDSLLPAEFMALSYRPEPWRPADSIVWGRLMALGALHQFRRREPAPAHVLPPLAPGDAVDLPRGPAPVAARGSAGDSRHGRLEQLGDRRPSYGQRQAPSGQRPASRAPASQHLVSRPSRVRRTRAGRGDGARRAESSSSAATSMSPGASRPPLPIPRISLSRRCSTTGNMPRRMAPAP